MYMMSFAWVGGGGKRVKKDSRLQAAWELQKRYKKRVTGRKDFSEKAERKQQIESRHAWVRESQEVEEKGEDRS
jgi:hypothetical protein